MADRPAYPPPAIEQRYARAGGRVVVHYVTTGTDAVATTDSDGDGVPDFPEEVADRAETTLAVLVDQLGFRSPRSDAGLADDGGDGRIDIYLRDLQLADGNFVHEGCTERPLQCTGHIVMENDFAGYAYPTPSIGIRVLVSHELFHAIQAAYDGDQPIAWHEGTAVWAEEVVFPEQDDFERLVAHFVARPYRPFDRPGGGFGDLYPYGAALWPYFLEQRFGAGTVRAIWERCEDHGDDPDFLQAAAAALSERGTSLEAAWIEHTRWNAETGSHARPGHYADAGRLPVAAREEALPVPSAVTLSMEGMSARYLPIESVTGPVRVVVDAELAVAVLVRAPDGTVDRIDGMSGDAAAVHHELDVRPAGDRFELVVTGIRRRALPRDVTVSVAPSPEPKEDPHDEPDEPDRGGCSAAGGADPFLLAIVMAWMWRRRRQSSIDLHRRRSSAGRLDPTRAGRCGRHD